MPPVVALCAKELLEGSVRQVEGGCVRAVLWRDRVSLCHSQHRLGIRVEDVEASIVNDARRPGRDVDEEKSSHRVVHFAHRNLRLGRRIPVQGEETFEAAFGEVEVSTDDFAPFHEVSLTKQLVAIETRAMQVDSKSTHELAGDNARDEKHPSRPVWGRGPKRQTWGGPKRQTWGGPKRQTWGGPKRQTWGGRDGLQLHGHSTAGKKARREQLLEHASCAARGEGVAGLDAPDGRDLHIVPNIALQHDTDTSDGHPVKR